MLPIILNNIFTRHRKDMAAAEKAREKARLSQRLSPRTAEGEASAESKVQSEAELKPQAPESKADRS